MRVDLRSRPLVPLLTVAVLGCSAVAFAGTASAEPEGKSTRTNTIRPTDSGAYKGLAGGRGESYSVRRTSLGGAKRGRQRRRRSMSFYGQITDPQMADEMSPARIEFVDPAGGNLTASWRAQEALGPFVFDSIIRNINRNRRSRVKNGNGARARLGWLVGTGDLADNQQKNETKWIVDILEGNTVDPFSGKRISASNPCGGSAAQTAKLNDDVANRRYTGVQDYSDYPDAPQERKRGFWDPSRPIDSSPYSAFPRYPGLLERAQLPFKAEGAQVPVYVARGNHDGLIQGNAPATEPLFSTIVTGCLKVYPSAGFDPNSVKGQSDAEVLGKLGDPVFLGQLLAGAGSTPPDPDRKFVSKPEYRAAYGQKNKGHGFGYTNSGELAASNGTALYYGYTPRARQRFISLDSVAEGGGQRGNIDEPQYRWLERELDASSSYEVTPSGRVVRDGDPDRFITLYAHHTLRTMDNENSDEEADSCASSSEPGCDSDPRASTPIHRGLKGDQSLRDLFLRFPNVVAYVAGHTHRNDLNPFVRRDRRGGFWEINTASHADWPQQSRLIDMVDNRDGTLSLFGTILDSAAPIAPPTPGATPQQVSAFSGANLASISRALSYNDPQRDGTPDNAGTSDGAGEKNDRNAEMILRDPRRRYWPNR